MGGGVSDAAGGVGDAAGGVGYAAGGVGDAAGGVSGAAGDASGGGEAMSSTGGGRAAGGGLRDWAGASGGALRLNRKKGSDEPGCTAAAVAACCLAAAASRTAVSIRERVWVEKLATTARKSAGCRWASAVMDACTRVESSVCGPSARLRGRGSERITRGAAALSGCWGCWGYLGC